MAVLTTYSFYGIYKGFWQSMHTVTSLSYSAVLLVLSLVFWHPLYLASLATVLVLALWSSGGLKTWGGYLRFVLPLAVLLVAVNLVVNRSGQTVFWQSPPLPLLGRLVFTWEVLCYGAATAARLVCVAGVFCLYGLSVHPDRLLGLFSRLAWRSALTTALATRLYPLMLSSWSFTREALEMRGVNFDKGSLIERAKAYSLVLRCLILGSLEDSLQLAEAMEARAFGRGPRSSYKREELRPRDWLVMGGCALSLLSAVSGLFAGLGSYSYYPRLESVSLSGWEILQLILILAGIILPVVIGWCWDKWDYIKLKI